MTTMKIDQTNIQEQAVLGAMLIDPTAVDKVSDLLTANDFYARINRDLFNAIVSLENEGVRADAVTVFNHLKLDDLSYVVNMARNTPSSANVRNYAETVKNMSIQRQLRALANNIPEICEGAGTIQEKLDEVQSRVFNIVESRVTTGPENIRSILTQVFDDIDRRSRQGGEITGLPTGFSELDIKTAGLHPGDFVIVAGRPSMGKSTFAMNIAQHVAVNEKTPALVFTLEMSNNQLGEKLLSSISQIDYQRIRTGKLLDSDWPKLTSAVSTLAGAEIHIDQTVGITVTELRARARRLKREIDIGLVIIDYLQLMTAESDNRAEAIGQISRGLKMLAKDIGVPVVALSQVNRNLEQRSDKRPIMSDLRESGSLEQDADLILFLYRDEVYNKETDAVGVAECIIAKQRNGPLDTIALGFDGHLSRFSNYQGPPLFTLYKQKQSSGNGSGFQYRQPA